MAAVQLHILDSSALQGKSIDFYIAHDCYFVCQKNAAGMQTDGSQ